MSKQAHDHRAKSSSRHRILASLFSKVQHSSLASSSHGSPWLPASLSLVARNPQAWEEIGEDRGLVSEGGKKELVSPNQS